MRETLTEACGALALDDDALIISLFLRTHQRAENVQQRRDRGVGAVRVEVRSPTVIRRHSW